MGFYPADAPVPAGPRTGEFTLRMLRESDVALDYDAVMASRDLLHLRSGGRWPRDGFTLEENLADLRMHEREFHERTSFTYTVMNPDESECLGCVYIYPLAELLRRIGARADDIGAVPADEAEVSFWVRQSRVADDLDKRLLAALLPWLRGDFAFSRADLRAFASERRHLAIFAEAGLRRVRSYPVADSRGEALLFA